MESRTFSDQKETLTQLKTQLKQIEDQIENIETQKTQYNTQNHLLKLQLEKQRPNKFEAREKLQDFEKKLSQSLYLFHFLPLRLSLYQVLLFSEPKQAELLIEFKNFSNYGQELMSQEKEIKDKIAEIEGKNRNMISIFNEKLSELVLEKSDLLEKIAKMELDSPRFFKPIFSKSESSGTFEEQDYVPSSPESLKSGF